MKNTDFVFVGIKGTAIALNRETGQTVWEVRLKGSDFVHLVLDDDNLYATTHGEVFCLNPKTGEGRWTNQLKGYGWGLVSIAVHNGSVSGMLPQVVEAVEEEKSRYKDSTVIIPSP